MGELRGSPVNPGDLPGPDLYLRQIPRISARSLGVDEENFEVLDIHVRPLDFSEF